MQHVVSQLITKKEELQGELKYSKQRIKDLEEFIRGVDTSIALFDPEYNVKSIKTKRYSPKQQYFQKGESHTMILDTLRNSDKPLSTSEIAISILKLKDMDIEDKSLRINVQKTLSTTLKKQVSSNLIRETHTDSMNNKYWEIVA
ncbi:hypothetical protein KKC13_12560 [bacterium]|nr:hypothetical protein [bacterium]MBU1959505.1 hypothetical protein [bacterium]